MRSIYSDRKKQKLKEQKERFHFKKHGYDGLTPRSRANHEARVIKQYGRTTKQMSNNVNARSRQWVNAVGDTLLRQTSGVQPVHRALVPFRSKFNPFESKVKHDKWHISVAKDNLLPRKHLRGGGLLDVEKSRILSESLSNSAVRLTQQKPVRLVQPKYRQPVRHCHALVRSLSICLVWLLEFLVDLCTMLPHSLLTFFCSSFLPWWLVFCFSLHSLCPTRRQEYPLRERDPTRDVGPSGGSIGGMVYKNFSDQERVKHIKTEHSVAADHQEPWNEEATRRIKMPVFRYVCFVPPLVPVCFPNQRLPLTMFVVVVVVVVPPQRCAIAQIFSMCQCTRWVLFDRSRSRSTQRSLVLRVG